LKRVVAYQKEMRYYLRAMARRCDISGKQTVAGKSRGHRRGRAGGVNGPWSKKAPATNRVFRPNIVKDVKVVVNGATTRLNLSTKVLKRIRKYGFIKAEGYGYVTLAN
jgi:ribosomal protein L28